MNPEYFIRGKLHNGDIHGKPIAHDKRVGYCWSSLHPGYLSESDVKEHQCICKNCPGLERFEDAGFWTREKNREIKRTQRKEMQRKEKIYKTNCQHILQVVRQMSKEFENFHVIDVKKDKNSSKYIINYVTLNRVDLFSLTSKIEKITGCGIIWRGVKNTFEKRKKILEKLKTEMK